MQENQEMVSTGCHNCPQNMHSLVLVKLAESYQNTCCEGSDLLTYSQTLSSVKVDTWRYF